MKNATEFGSAKITDVQKVLEAIQRHNQENKEVEITFEFLVGSLFPSLYNNFTKRIMDEHTKGYAEGYQDGLAAGKEGK